MLGQCVKTVNALVAALRHAEHHLVLQQVHAAVGIHKVKAVLVHIGRSGDVQLIHLLLTGRDEQIAIRALLDLGLEGAGRVEVEPEGHLRVLCRVALTDSVQRLGERGGGKHDQLHALGCFRGSGGRGSHGRCCAGSAAAGGEGSGCTGHTGCDQKAPAGNAMVVHLCFSLLQVKNIYFYAPSRKTGQRNLTCGRTRRPDPQQCVPRAPSWAGCTRGSLALP